MSTQKTVKKRKKVTRHRGSHTHSRGAKKKARGKGHRGGIGNAGSGKRADHKKVLKTSEGKKYFGKRKITRARTTPTVPSITLRTIKENIANRVASGEATEKGGKYEMKVIGHKIIGTDIGNLKITIHAKAASKGAIEAVKKAGGEIIIFEKTEETKETPQPAKKEEPKSE